MWARYLLVLAVVAALHIVALYGVVFPLSWGSGPASAYEAEAMLVVPVAVATAAQPVLTRERSPHGASKGDVSLPERAQSLPVPVLTIEDEAVAALPVAVPPPDGTPLTALLTLHYQLAELQGVNAKHGESWLRLNTAQSALSTSWTWRWGTAEETRFSVVPVTQTLSTPVDSADGLHVPGNPIQDDLSVIWVLSRLLTIESAEPSMDPQKVWQIQTRFGDESHDMTWRLQPQDELMLPAGRFRAVQISGESTDPRAPHLSVWFAPQLRFLPVRIRRTDPTGVVLDALLKEAII